ncbi:MAG TPA: guanitoxin biosynthesis heme-dependent pre-guanitoxin N-hydroxylase GntA [Pyrinomonadaceae bacterium]|nr:guanitoxin biosynthesis heme-dependent pre-guanitoxin N-hydroxylase GntA [Pyrinomonadaceae bacterium]
MAEADRPNPFGGPSVRSAYAAWSGGRLAHPLEPSREPSPLAERVHEEFRSHVLGPDFSCVGARAALRNNTYRFGLYGEMSDDETTRALAFDLCEYARERPAFETDFATFVACFDAHAPTDERGWERALWSQLQALHDLDRPHHAWDAAVSSDPEDPAFSFSFAGTAFFVVGLHPASSRLARRFRWPTLVFNAHEQFERLRERNEFARIREAVRARDYKLQGSLNPNLSDYGERSEARQYSGRAVEEGWRCPFHARGGKRDED